MKGKILAYLRQLPIIVYLVVAGSAAVVGGYQYWAHVQQEYGKRDLLIAQAERTNADLLRSRDSLAKVYHIDTLRLVYNKRIFDTLTVNVDRWKRDTLKVVEYVTRADSTVQACTQALSTCEARIGVAQRGWDGASGEIAIMKKQMPSKAKPWLYGALGVGAGYLAGRIIK